MLDIDFEDDFGDLDIERILMSKLCEIEDETLLMQKIVNIFYILQSTPDSVLRPYQQHFVTDKYVTNVIQPTLDLIFLVERTG